MGTKAYNGTTMLVVKDITGLEEAYALCQAGKSFVLYSREAVLSNGEQLLDEATEEDTFVYWHNAYLLGEIF